LNQSACQFTIEHVASGEIIGMMGLKQINRVDSNAEVEYWIGRRLWRLGIGTEALQLLLDYAFGPVRLHRVYAIVHEQNISSVALLEKSKFTREATWRLGGKPGEGITMSTVTAY